MRWAPDTSLPGSSRATNAIDRFYGLGVYAAVISMVVCLAVLIYAGIQMLNMCTSQIGYGGSVVSHFVSRIWATNAPISKMLVKRQALQQAQVGIKTFGRRAYGHDEGSQLLRPVIPGLTLPLGHIWYYLIALVVCALVHEFGHALAAAGCAGVRMRKMGVFILGLYPGAFVDLPREQLEKQPVKSQLRVVCAGVWHNAVTALVAWLLVYSGGLGLIFSVTGWSKVADGVVVVDVSQSSPLYDRIPLLSTISRIDDVMLSAAQDSFLANDTISNSHRLFASSMFGSSPIARWTKILTDTANNRDTTGAGFCVWERENMDDGLCCEMTSQFPLGESPDTDIYCFDPYSSSQLMSVPMTDETMCFNLKTVFERSDLQQRCHSHIDCESLRYGQTQIQRGTDIVGVRRDRAMCALPSSPFPDSRVARIYYRSPNGINEDDQLIIYVGSLASLWLDIQVSSLRPRWLWLPYKLPSWTESLLQYVLSFSLAFCLLNAVPAWYLDGDHILRLLLIAYGSRSSNTVDDHDEVDEVDDDGEEKRDCDKTMGLGDSEADDEQESSSDSSSLINDVDGLHSDGQTEEEQDQESEDEGLVDGLVLGEMSPACKRIYRTVTALTTGLLVWCIVASIALIAF
ncbi:hypothetical protein FB645_002865 [Coemansia sp. IMI 203386]|nr:hypothetical protein FB645_002865 [Coemansia sp. IMI 203386]